MRQAQSEALAWITTNLHKFLSLTVERFVNLWVGHPYLLRYFGDVMKLTVLAIIGLCLAIPNIKIPERAALLIPLVTYPLIYYIVAYEPRYRIPINWILYLLAGVVVWVLIGGLVGKENVKARSLDDTN